MNYQIKGGSFPVVEVTMQKGQRIISESGAMCWRDSTFQMETTSNGGFDKVIGRLFTGEKLFHNIYTATEDNSKIAFGSCIPGTIKAIEIKPGEALICQKSSFLFGIGNIDLSIFFNKKIGSGLFSGEGFIMQKITGSGIVFIEIDGTALEYELKTNEQIVISTGHLVSMSESCRIDVEQIHGIKNIFLGGEGLFNTVITGPGTVIVQTMPLAKLASNINQFLPHDTSNNNGKTY